MSEKPLQKTTLQSAVNIGEGTSDLLPRILSRPVVIANYILKKLAGKDAGIEPKIDKIMAEQFLDPKKLAKTLEDIPMTQRKMVIDAIMKNAYGPGVIGAPSVMSAEQIGG